MRPKIPVMERLWKNIAVLEDADCWLWQAATLRNGYGVIRDGDKIKYVHRLIWSSQHGEIPQGYYICHKCDVRNCANPNHLFLGTAQDNTADMYSKGRHPGGGAAGEKNQLAKLNARKIQLMKQRRQAGVSYKAIAEEFGVSDSVARKAIIGLSYRRGATTP